MRHRVGHRGAPAEFPANTMKGFARAVALGCNMVECDVRRAADGVLVLAHDDMVRDTQGRRYGVSWYTSGELSAVDLGAGEGVPMLTELVEWARGRCAVMADMKCEGDGVETAVCTALAPLPPDDKLVPGAGEESRRRLRSADPRLPLSLSLDREAETWLRDGGFERLLEGLDTEAVTWEHPLLTCERIDALRARGRRVYAWTVDDPAVMRHLQGQGVDGIISNRTDLLARLL